MMGFFLQCFSEAFLCMRDSYPGKKAPGGCMLVHLLLEGCCPWPGRSVWRAARSQPRGHQAPPQLWQSPPTSGPHVVT